MPDKLLGPSFKFHFEGNADEACVREGHTFYSNSETLRTGTLTDRNTVGKNGCVEINSNYPKVAFSWGSNPQCTTLLDGVWAFAIKTPYGYYDGNTYVGVTQGDVASAIGLTADKIRSGQQILGITGTFNGDNGSIRIELAGRVWSNGVANASGHAGSAYAYGTHDAYSARLYASVSGNYGVYFKDGWSFRWYNAGAQLIYTGPDSGYGSGQAYYAHH